MNNVKLKIGALAVIAGLYSAGASAETATGVATANVLTPLVIDSLITMDFTDIAGGTSGGTLIMDDAGGVTTTGDAIVIGGGGGTALGFDVTGENGQTVIISVSDGVLNNGGNNMNLAMAAVAPLSTDGSAQSVTVGGTLNVAAGQAGGAYTTATGTAVTITANYQ
ncbi:MAG: hypothetical protein DRQ44_16910 [Gammaproteobacteria bacterium]|nr:MAG: hypothetical protein DRQ44_16910 [Gammaproteobacteria bacterium]